MVWQGFSLLLPLRQSQLSAAGASTAVRMGLCEAQHAALLPKHCRCLGCAFAQVRTYDVVPVSPSLGLVEYVPGTLPLKDAIAATLGADGQARAAPS